MQSSLFSAGCSLLRRRHSCRLKVATPLLFLAAAFPVNAKPMVEQQNSESSWGLGIGIYSQQKAYVDIERKNRVIPVLTFENQYVRLTGPELALKLPGYQLKDLGRFDFSLIGRLDINDYDESDTRILEGMEDRDGGFWAGAKIEWKSSWIQISTEFLQAVSGDSDGSRFNLGIEKTWHFAEKYMLTPRVEVKWRDENYVDYYYGVRADEVTSWRPFYEGSSAINIEAGIRAGYMPKHKHFIFLDVSATSLADEIKDSPLVDRSTETNVFLGYVYRF